MIDALPWLILFLPLARGFYDRFGHELVASHQQLDFRCRRLHLFCRQLASSSPIQIQIRTGARWIDLWPMLDIPFAFVLDRLSKTMLVLVTGVGALIHIYSLGYMREDEGKSRYFAALSFFMFAMLGIVLANNFVMMFIFWELVGVSSYLLIGHWFERDAAADAAKKAFITNRIGDFGFMLGILMVWTATGSVVFSEIASNMSKHHGASRISHRRPRS